jgi:hypothetical protein
MAHVCDNRCFGENGHHSWPSPGKDECLCSQTLRGEKVWCPVHNGMKETEVVEEPLEVRLVKALNPEQRKRVLEALQKVEAGL